MNWLKEKKPCYNKRLKLQRLVILILLVEVELETSRVLLLPIPPILEIIRKIEVEVGMVKMELPEVVRLEM